MTATEHLDHIWKTTLSAFFHLQCCSWTFRLQVLSSFHWSIEKVHSMLFFTYYIVIFILNADPVFSNPTIFQLFFFSLNLSDQWLDVIIKTILWSTVLFWSLSFPFLKKTKGSQLSLYFVDREGLGILRT